MARRFLVKFAYSGRETEGSARQPGRQTVEGQVLHALVRGRILADPRAGRFQSASRTDRGVAAAGNVVGFTTEARPARILATLNALAPGCLFYGLASVPLDFNARHALRRTYRYILPRRGRDIAAVKHGAGLFQGIHDFRRFCRAEGHTTIRSIESIEVRKDGRFLLLDFTADSFLWNMVRRIVAALDRMGQGQASDADIKAALAGRSTANFGLAPAEGLILMDVAYDVPFTVDKRTTARLQNLLESATDDAERRQLHVESVWMGLNEVTGASESSDEWLE